MTKSGQNAPYWLDPEAKTLFPDVNEALKEPNGLLAIGGDLSVERLLAAYRRGIFPWYSHGQPILWWCPQPRAILRLNALKVSRSLRKSLKRKDYQVRFDTAFENVIMQCAKPRKDGLGTWITEEMRNAYIRLHKLGHAHSIEVWDGEQLIGGLYGISIGKIFFGESMFSRRTDASKIAFVYLVRQLQKWAYALIDCQVYSEHLGSLGAEQIPRKLFISYLENYCDKPGKPGHWQCDLSLDEVLLRHE
ncbi:MAG: leucyl/phenylalanyl-tRNA--protein transferase [Gammaproteobacteria bacterium]|jgi:leucyl/phenylalanyl-tRNA---protein transferase